MQISYPYGTKEMRDAYAPMWYPPMVDSVARDLEVPPVYAPYVTDQFWPNSYVNWHAGVGSAPAPTPAAAAVSGQALSPISLVSPMPSITPPSPVSIASNTIPTPTQPSFTCSLSQWVSANPILATLIGIGAFFAFSGGHKR